MSDLSHVQNVLGVIRDHVSHVVMPHARAVKIPIPPPHLPMPIHGHMGVGTGVGRDAVASGLPPWGVGILHPQSPLTPF